MGQQPLTGWGEKIQYYWEVGRTLLWGNPLEIPYLTLRSF